jgi:hypothetical protein
MLKKVTRLKKEKRVGAEDERWSGLFTAVC